MSGDEKKIPKLKINNLKGILNKIYMPKKLYMYFLYFYTHFLPKLQYFVHKLFYSLCFKAVKYFYGGYLYDYVG